MAAGVEPEAAQETAPKRSAGATRARILEATSRLFYSQGIRATSADRIIEEVGITKVTFYRHFRTKSDLVVAYLDQQASAEREWFERVRRAGDAVTSLHAIAAGIGTVSCSPGFRGCAFINAAAEFADPHDPVRAAVDHHRRWMLEEFAGISEDAGVRDAQEAARQLMILRDGAMVNGYLGAAESVTASLEAAFDSVLAASRT
ncbi:TetR family transcriptional regulator [Xylanimonas oleitrophica]|uniref:TetR family transcriptional regulator n=1 Tax=Xylanimonas oleitrophica TaxID=2607479 RepID=A0A2W5Y2Y8_9MICO|nr:TetR/AcrR family transcriptional regulator [Xylanimonas oleitrophica]PZR52064.1 TetR family transcriptional regulator [Xylanimonas oleitrophica]